MFSCVVNNEDLDEIMDLTKQEWPDIEMPQGRAKRLGEIFLYLARVHNG